MPARPFAQREELLASCQRALHLPLHPHRAQAHIWLLLVGWGFLIPCGVVIARCFKSHDPYWFQLHRWVGWQAAPALRACLLLLPPEHARCPSFACPPPTSRRAMQSLGLLLGLAGFALGFVIAGGWDTAFTTHRNLGMAATVFGVLQVGQLAGRRREREGQGCARAAAARCHSSSSYRPARPVPPPPRTGHRPVLPPAPALAPPPGVERGAHLVWPHRCGAGHC